MDDFADLAARSDIGPIVTNHTRFDLGCRVFSPAEPCLRT